MSLNIKTPTGLQRIAGSTVILDATASEIREGTFTMGNNPSGWCIVNIIFDVPMPDTEYVVNIEPSEYSCDINTSWRITDKTVNGFKLSVYGSVTNITGKYYAIRLVKLEGYTELQNKVNNPDSAPTKNSTNLVTSGGVYDAIASASKIFINSESAWNELDAETKATYQVAIFIDKPNVNAVDSTDGSTAIVGEPNKRWVGTQVEWDNLTAAEKAEFEIVCFTDGGDASIATQFATISSEGAVSTIGDYICSKNGKNVCVMLKGHTDGIVTNGTKLYSGFFNPLTPSTYPYLDIPFAIRNRTTNVTEMRIGYLDATGNFYTSAYTEDIASGWDIQLFFSYQTK